MNWNLYQQLKTETAPKSFWDKYKSMSDKLYNLSYFAQGLSILFGFFELSRMLLSTTDETSAGWYVNMLYILTILILFGIEAWKRTQFTRFSDELTSKNLSFSGAEIKILIITGLIPVIFSFYLAINGASEWMSQKDKIADNTDSKIEQLEKSIEYRYDSLISIKEKDNIALFEANQERSDNFTQASTQREKKLIQEQINSIDSRIKSNNATIKELKSEKLEAIKKVTDRLKEKAKRKLNNGDIFSFIILIGAAVIELLILGGIFFPYYLKYRSRKEYDDVMKNDPRFKQFSLYNNLLDVIYKGKVGDAIPIKTNLIKSFKYHQIDLYGKELDETLKLLTSLNILQKRGSKRFIKMDHISAQEEIRKHLKIE